MKKSILLGMPKLTASPEMKKVALEDEPEKVRTYSGYTRIRRKYKCYMNCMVQNGILKAALYLPDYLRLDGDNPAYEVFLDKKKRQFLTYDYMIIKLSLHKSAQQIARKQSAGLLTLTLNEPEGSFSHSQRVNIDVPSLSSHLTICPCCSFNRAICSFHSLRVFSARSSSAVCYSGVRAEKANSR